MSVRLYINYLEGEAPYPLPAEATPAKVPNRRPELREWQAIEHIWREGLYRIADHTALLSPMFPAKTGISYESVVGFVRDNPGHDLYLFDRGAAYRYYSYNIFELSEAALPGLGVKFQAGFAAVGQNVDLPSMGRSLPGNSVLGNAWVGSARFWRETVGEAIRLIETIEKDTVLWRHLCEPVVWNGKIYPFMPFVLERFVPWWLMTRDGLSVKAWPYDRHYVLGCCVREVERPVVQGFYDMINAWDANGHWRPDRRAFIGDLCRAVWRHVHASNGHMVYPWTGGRIEPVA